MKVIRKASYGLVGLFCGGIIAFFMLSIFFPAAKPLLTISNHQKETAKYKDVVQFTAVGDSLTEGIGDSTNSGGFVPLVANSLTEIYGINGVETHNFGVSGDRSDQILKRIKNDKKLQAAVKKADFITITVGGNDLMKTAKKDLLNNISQESFVKPMQTYQKQLAQMYTELRKLNASAPIYQVGIYNPYYLDFPEMTELQKIVDNWNDASAESVAKQKNAYFIPINDLIYKGSGQQSTATSTTTNNSESQTAASSTKNDLLYEQDHFHPNNLGYQIMANAVEAKLAETKKEWLYK